MNPADLVARDLHFCKQSDYRFLFPIPGLNDHRLIALTRCVFQLRSLYNIYLSTSVLNQACLLQNASRDGNARPSRAQHVGEKFLRQRNSITAKSILTHQQPSS
jgi:hypothetical protein